MSSNVDDRILRLQFDDSGFEAGAEKAIGTLGRLENALNLDGATNGLENVKRSVDNFNMDGVSESVEAVQAKFSAFDSFTLGVFSRLGERVLDFGAKMVKNIWGAVTKGPVDGFQEYEAQMKSVQTISANSGESLEVIQANLDKLNEYADKTSYKFSDMTSAIGRFTAAGMGVEESTKAIQGFFNVAALAGAGPQEAARGVYQLSQAMSSGVIKLQDWRSIENASIDTEKFRNIITLTAKHMGVTSDKFDEMTKGNISFRESLADGWLTAEVMQNALENLTKSTMDYTDAEQGRNELTKELVANGYTEEEAKQIIQIASAADQSAREIRTFSAMVDTLGEAIGSGWATTWRLIIGDYKESAEFFTWISGKLSGIVEHFSNARNGFLQEWRAAFGREALIGTIANTFESVERIITPIYDAFVDVFSVPADLVADFMKKVAEFTEVLVIDGDTMNSVNKAFHDFFMTYKNSFSVLGRMIDSFVKIGTVIFTILQPALLVLWDLFKTSTSVFAYVTGVIETNVSRLFNRLDDFFTPIMTLVKNVQQLVSDLGTAFMNVFLNSQVGQKLHKQLDSIKGFFDAFNILKFLQDPLDALFQGLKKVNDYISGIGGDNRLKVFEDWFHSIATVVGGPLNALVDGLEWLWGIVWNFASGHITSGLTSFFDLLIMLGGMGFDGIGWLFNLISDISFDGIIAWIKEIKDSNPFVNFVVPTTLLDSLVDLKDKFVDLLPPLGVAKSDLAGFVWEASKKIAISGKNKVLDLASKLSEAFSNLWDYFKKLNSNGGTFKDRIVTMFRDAYHALQEWLGKISAGTDGFASTIAKGVSFLLDKIKDLPSKLLEFFNGTKDAANAGVQNVKSTAEGFQQEATGFFDSFLNSLPTIGDITSAIGNLFSSVADAIVGGMTSLSVGDAAGLLGEHGIFSMFDFSQFKITLPDWKGPLTGLVEDFSNILDLIPDKRLDEITTTIANIAKRLGGLGFAFAGWRYLGSLSKLNRGLGKSGEGLGKFLKELPTTLEKTLPSIFGNFGKHFMEGFGKEIGAGLKNIGEGLKNFMKNGLFKESLAKKFKLIAEGLVMLAGAMLLLSKIPATDMDRVTQTMAKLAAGMLLMAIAMAGVQRLLGSDVSGMGAVAAGIGIGIAALVGSLWVLTKIPQEEIDRAMATLQTLVVLVIGGFGVIAFAGQNTNFKGMAASLLAFSVAIALLIGPIVLLGYLWQRHQDILVNGGVMLAGIAAIVVGSMSLMAEFTKADQNWLGVSVAIIALTAALTVMSGLLLVLGFFAGAKMVAGVVALAALAAIISGAIALMATVIKQGQGLDLALASVALISLSVAIGLAAAVLIVLGTVADIAGRGLGSLIIIAAVLTGAISILSIVGATSPGLVAATGAMILMSGAIAILAVVLIALGAMSTYADRGLTALVTIGLLLTVMVGVIGILAINIAGLIAGVAAMTVASIAIGLAAVIVAGMGVVAAMHPEGFNKALEALVDIVLALTWVAGVGTFLGGGLMALSGAFAIFGVGLIALAGGLIALEEVNWDFVTSGWTRLWDSFASTNTGKILIDIANGFMENLGLLADIAGTLVHEFLSGVKSFLGINSPSTEMEAIGEFSIEGFLNGISNGLGLTAESGDEVGNTFLSSFEDLPDQLGESASNGIQSFVNSLDTNAIAEKGSELITSLINSLDTESITAKGTEILDGLINGMTDGLGEKLGDVARDFFLGFIDPFNLHFLIASPSKVMEEKGGNIIDGFVNGITNGLESLGTAAGKMATAVLDGLGSLGKWFLDRGGEVVEKFKMGIGNGTPGVQAKASALGDGALKGIATLPSGFKTKVNEGMNGFVAGITGKMAAVKVAAAGIVTNVKNSLTQLASAMKAKANEASSAFVSGLTSGASRARSAASSIVASAKSGLSSLYGTFYDVGANGGRGLVNGLNSMISSASWAAYLLGQQMAKSAKKALKEASPSKVFKEIGMFAGEGLIIGVQGTYDAVAKTGETLGGILPESFSTTMQAMSVDIDDILDTDYNPVITPVIDGTQFDYDLNSLSNRISSSMMGVDVNAMNYNEMLSGKLDSLINSNDRTAAAVSSTAIDYDRLGLSIANALIQSGVHVEMDGGQLMGYLAGEIRDARRTFG